MNKKCGVCKGPCYLLGSFGKTKHYRCRNCGMQYMVSPLTAWDIQKIKENEQKRKENNEH